MEANKQKRKKNTQEMVKKMWMKQENNTKGEINISEAEEET